jgi:hypothetical protein|tara:strand:- start:191 stop:625 length:435 start_codon:yes stop_codon:yes gene_type:complete
MLIKAMKRKTNFEKAELGYWMLPKPNNIKSWERVPRLTKRSVPFGYEIDTEDDSWLMPISRELELLELAKKHLKQYSYREVSAWLTTQSGRSITHDGLKKRIDVERRRKSLAAIKRKLASWLEETIAQYETLEKERIGTYTYKD